MKKLIYLSLSIFAIYLAQSCSIQKRQHLKGYHIVWNTPIKKSKESFQKVEKSAEKIDLSATIQNEELGNSSSINKYNVVQTEATDASITDQTADYPSESKIIPKNKKTEIINYSPEKIAKKNNSFSITKKNLFLKKNETTKNENVKVSGFAIASLVCGIIAMFTTLIGAIIFAILGMVFGLIAMNKIRKNPELLKGKGMAWAGYILGLLAILIWTIIL